MNQSAFSGRLRLVGGMLVGTAVIGAAVAFALEKVSKGQDNSSKERTIREVDELDGSQGSETDGILNMNKTHFQIAGLSDPGKRRANNQDCFKVGQLSLPGDEYVLAVVCDGMGGHAGGEVASKIATDLIWTVLSKHKHHEPKKLYETMTEALERADSAIEQRASKESELKGMGTTAVVAAINRDSYIHCHLGDSRLYHFRDGECIYQTKDHSVVRFLVEEGIITPDRAKDHPYRSQLTSSLGGGPNANRLTIEPKWDESATPHRKWNSGDWLLLCSDGLNSELEDAEIGEVLTAASTPKEAVEALRKRVLETEARDNLTFVAARKD